jgi:hypothetical protein
MSEALDIVMQAHHFGQQIKVSVPLGQRQGLKTRK